MHGRSFWGLMRPDRMLGGPGGTTQIVHEPISALQPLRAVFSSRGTREAHTFARVAPVRHTLLLAWHP
eukprot:365767-Chlamydomonas_euryale.AAC.11